MRTAWRKVFRDFTGELGRSVFVVLAIAAGVAGFSAVLSSRAILTRALNEGYLATNPASATIRTDRVDDALVAAVLSGHGVSDAEPRRTVSGRMRVGPAEWRNVVFFVVKDYGNIRVSRLVREGGAWPPGPGEMLVERDAFGVARAKIGDTVIVRTAHGEDTPLRITGRVHDVGQAQARMENLVYAYVTLATLERLGEEPYLDQLNILAAENRFDEAHVRKVAAEVAKVVEAAGHPVRRLDVPEPGKHPHASINGLLLLSMSAFGLFVLVLAGILVVNLMTAMLASQVRQIGVLKTVGGTRAKVAAIYLAHALLLGVAAVVIAIPAGQLGARILSRAMAVFLNFDVPSFATPAWIYALAGAIGVATPLVAALVPVWRATGVTVREALADYGVSRSAFGTSRFDRAIAGVGGATRPVLLALRNGFRRRGRLVLTVVTLAAGGVFFLSALNVRAALAATLDKLFATRKFDLSVGLGGMQRTEAVERAARATRGILRTECWIATEGTLADPAEEANKLSASSPHEAAGGGGLHGGGRGGGGASPDRFTVLAIPAPTTMLAPDFAAGRALAAGDVDAIVVNTALVSKWPAVPWRVGETVSFRMGPATTTWRVVGIVREPFSPPVAYVPLRFFEMHGHEGVANSVRFTLARTDRASVDRTRSDLETNLRREGIRALSSTTAAESRFGFDQHMLMISVFLLVVSALLGGVGGLGLATTTSIHVLERRRELGILRAIGATPAAVRRIVVAEAAVVALLAWAVAVVVAYPVGRAAGDAIVRLLFPTGLEPRYQTGGALVWLAVSLVLAAAASAAPAWRASRRPIREALEYE
jgi:putative ABC transport system permease protein